MDNKEGTVIGFGCLALSALYYFYRIFSEERTQFKTKINQLEQTYRAKHKGQSSVDYQALQQQNTSKMVILHNVPISRLEKDTYKKYIRQIRKDYLQHAGEDSFEEDQSGGSFEIREGEQPIIVELNSCNIERGVLKEDKRKNIVFEENKHKDAVYYSLTYSINALKHLTLYGAIRYSLAQNTFTIEPLFILSALDSEEKTVQKMIDYWNDKIYKITFKKLALGFLMLSAGYLLMYRPLKSIYLRYKTKLEGVSEGQFEYFKEKVEFKARPASALNCEFCHSKTVSYIYECGHLVACQQCHLKMGQDHRCSICNKKSKKFIKIFI